MMQTAVEIANLTIRDARGALLVDDVSMRVAPGETLTLIGETGSGKSLIASALFGLLPAEFKIDGTIAIGAHRPVDARDAPRLQAFWRSDTMLVPQEPSTALDPIMRARRQMALAGLASDAVLPSLAAVDLSPGIADAYPFELSGGMNQRVLVATALGIGSPIVVADEPTKGLDPDRVDQTVQLMRRLIDGGRTLIVVTHDKRVAEGLPGTIGIVRHGRIVEQGPVDRVLSAPRSDYGRAWLAADPVHWPMCRRSEGASDMVLAAHDLAFGWTPDKPLFRDLDLHVERGTAVAVTGPSGCGKSTLGNILLGLQKPTAGHVHWGGADITADPHAIRSRRRGYQKLAQDPSGAFIPGMTIRRQLAALRDVKRDLAIDQDLPPLLERLRIDPVLLDRRPDQISGGQAQRLALARILLLDPAVIIADEPTSRLDPVVQKDTMRLLRDCVDERRLGLILICHDRAIVRAMADEEVRIGW